MRATFAALVLAGGHGLAREALADALWGGERPPKAWASSLRTYATRVRRLVGEAFPGDEDRLVCTAGRYRLRLPDDVVLDVAEAEACVASARAHAVAGRVAESRAEAERAVALAEPGFGVDLDSDWADEQRARATATLVAALELASAAASLLGDATRAVSAARQAVGLDRERESAHRHLVVAHARAGDRTAAVRAHQALRMALADVGLTPSDEAEALLVGLLGDHPDEAVGPAAWPPPGPAPASGPPPGSDLGSGAGPSPGPGPGPGAPVGPGPRPPAHPGSTSGPPPPVGSRTPGSFGILAGSRPAGRSDGPPDGAGGGMAAGGSRPTGRGNGPLDDPGQAGWGDGRSGGADRAGWGDGRPDGAGAGSSEAAAGGSRPAGGGGTPGPYGAAVAARDQRGASTGGAGARAPGPPGGGRPTAGGPGDRDGVGSGGVPGSGTTASGLGDREHRGDPGAGSGAWPGRPRDREGRSDAGGNEAWPGRPGGPDGRGDARNGATPALAGAAGGGPGDGTGRGRRVVAEPPFVGRAAALRALGEAWADARERRGGVVLVTGRAGCGRTRLLQEAARIVATDHGQVLAGRCDARAADRLQPFAEAIDPVLVTTPPGELALGEADRAALAAIVPAAGVATRAERGRARAAARHDGPPPGGPEDDLRVGDAVIRLVDALAYDGPVLLAIDDAHRADEPTAALLLRLARRLRDTRLLVVVTARTMALAHNPPMTDVVRALAADGLVRRVTVGDLADADVAELAGVMTGDTLDASGVARRLAAEAAGNPRLVVELLRHHGSDAGRVPPAEAVRDVVRERIDALRHRSDPVGALLSAGSMLGPSFSLEVAAHVAGLDEATALDALDAALAAGMVADAAPGDGTYRFAQGVVRRVLADDLSVARRRVLHARAADAIAARHADELEGRLVEVAEHRAAAAPPGGDADAARWLWRAAAHAASTGAQAQQLTLLARAEALLPAGAGELRAEVAVDLALARLAVGDARASGTVVEGVALARSHGRGDLVTRAALATARQAADDAELAGTAAALLDLALQAEPAGGPTHARLLARAIELAGTGPAVAAAAPAVPALRVRLDELDGPDGLDERLDVAHELATLARAASDREAQVVAAHHHAAAAATLGDDWALDEALAELHALATGGAPAAATLLRQRAAAEAALQGRFADAAALTDPDPDPDTGGGKPRCGGPEDVGARQALVAAWLRGATGPGLVGGDAAEGALLAVERGEPERARLLLRSLALGGEPLPAGDGRLHALGVAALAAAQLGDADVAAGVYDLLEPYSGRLCGVGYRTFAGAAAYHLGCLAAVIGELAEAEGQLNVAMGFHLALGARPWSALTQLALADVLEREGRYAERETVATLRAEAEWAIADLGLRSRR